MIHFPEKDLNEAHKVYLVSNTPSYFVRRGLEISSLTELSRNHSSEELVGFIKESIRTRSKKDAEKAALVEDYAILTALLLLTLKGDRSAIGQLLGHGGNVRWYNDIITILMQQITPTDYVDMEHGPDINDDHFSDKDHYSGTVNRETWQ